jgi:hypothetical protein
MRGGLATSWVYSDTVNKRRLEQEFNITAEEYKMREGKGKEGTGREGKRREGKRRE